MEDILSYSQLFLALKTKSVNVKVENNCVSFLNGYKIMFDRLLPFRTGVPSPDEINTRDIEKMRELLHNNDVYKKYKEEKAKKKEEEIKERQKGKIDIKSMQNIPRYNNFEEDDSEESDESVEVVPLKLNTESKDKADNKVINNKNPKNEEAKEEEKKEPEKTEEEIIKEKEMKKKVEENELKRKEVDKVLSKALLDFDFDSGSENKESEEF